PFMFQNLKVYQKALDFADSVASLVEPFDRRHRVLADQLTRASISIPLNIAEGNGRLHEGDRKQFFAIARGSVHECVALLELCRRRNLVDEKLCSGLTAQLETVGKMLGGLMSGLERKSR
ncbi:MAG TPA: four helix bundle protein, partial [Armatimonadota bacterium]|nr:four helix bundle protein [Armatimonadota bacterium]